MHQGEEMGDGGKCPLRNEEERVAGNSVSGDRADAEFGM